MIKKSILIIDEEVDIRELLEYYFTQNGYQVYHTDMTNEGIQFAVSNHPDIILLGTFPSEEDRAKAYHELRSIPSLFQSNIMCLTTDSNFHTRSYNKAIHNQDCIQTPILPRELLRSIERRFESAIVSC